MSKTKDAYEVSLILRMFFKWCLKKDVLQAFIEDTPEIKEFLASKRKEQGQEVLDQWVKEVISKENYKEIIDKKKQRKV